MNPHPNPKHETPHQGRPFGKTPNSSWLIAGIVFLFLLAAFSSVDPSLVYILLGIVVFCFFMALRGWISSQSWRKNQSQKDFAFNFKFNTGARQQRTYQPPSDTKKTARGAFIVIGAMVVFFVVIVVVAVFVTDDAEGEVQYYRSAAGFYLESSEYDSAQVNYRRALRLRPDDIASRNGYGKSLYFKQQYDSAIIVFNGVNELDPYEGEARLFRGKSYYYQKRYPEALREAQQLVADEPDNTEAFLLGGDILYTQENFEEALTIWYEPAYALGARNAYLCWIMAWIYDEKRKDLEKAIPLYKEALAYDDSIADIYHRLSEITSEPEATQYRNRAAELKQGSSN